MNGLELNKSQTQTIRKQFGSFNTLTPEDTDLIVGFSAFCFIYIKTHCDANLNKTKPMSLQEPSYYNKNNHASVYVRPMTITLEGMNRVLG